MFGAQVGQGLGGLAQEVVSATDIGLPLGPAGTAALLPENVAAFGEGLERPVEEVRLYLALREAAHQRLFGHVPWLRQPLLDTVEAYARGITSTRPRWSGRWARSTRPTRRACRTRWPAACSSHRRPRTAGRAAPARDAARPDRGLGDAVVYAAAGDRMPGAAALRETSRRRRAAGGPAEADLLDVG